MKEHFLFEPVLSRAPLPGYYDSVSNTVFNWHFDPLISLLYGTLGITSAIVFCMLMFAIGIVANCATNLGKARAVVIGALTTSFVAFAVSLNLIAWSTLYLLPLFLFILSRLSSLTADRPKTVMASLLIGALLAWNGSIAAPLIVLLSFLGSDYRKLLPRFSYLFVIIFIFSLFSNYLVTIPDLPAYPTGGRVIPARSMLAGLDPLLGPASPIQILDRATVSSAFVIWAFGSLLLVIVSAPFRRNLVALIVAFFLLLELLPVPESVQLLSPLYASARILPKAFYLNLVPIYLGVAAGLSATKVSSKSRFLIYSIVSLVVIVAGLAGDKSELYEKQREVVRLLDEASPQLVFSPSLPLLLEYGVVEPPSAPIPYEFHSLALFHPKIAASNRMDLVTTLLNRPNDARWTNGEGSQDGDEWLLIQFDQPRLVAAVRVLPGTFSADFPRGLRISFSDSCDLRQPPESSKFTQLFRRDRWKGPIKFTQDGFPYLGPESDVEIRFEETVSVSCLLIEQIGQVRGFDWSVQRIQLSTPAGGLNLLPEPRPQE